MLKVCVENADICKRLSPIYNEAIKDGSQRGYFLAQIHGDQNPLIMETYHIISFPTIIVFLNHDPTPIYYDGDKNPSALISWLDTKIITTFEEIEKDIFDSLL